MSCVRVRACACMCVGLCVHVCVRVRARVCMCVCLWLWYAWGDCATVVMGHMIHSSCILFPTARASSSVSAVPPVVAVAAAAGGSALPRSFRQLAPMQSPIRRWNIWHVNGDNVGALEQLIECPNRLCIQLTLASYFELGDVIVQGTLGSVATIMVGSISTCTTTGSYSCIRIL